MNLSLEELEAASAEMEKALGNGSEKLTDLSSEVLLERHDALVTERLGMPDTLAPAKRAAVTNKVKRIEEVLRERGVEFVGLPQANQPAPIDGLSDEELIGEMKSIAEEYPAATAGRKSSLTTRRKGLLAEVNARIEARTQSVEPAENGETEVNIEAQEPTDEEIAKVESAEGSTATKTRTPRRRRS